MSNKNDAIEELLGDIKRYASLHALQARRDEKDLAHDYRGGAVDTQTLVKEIRQESRLAFSNIRDSLYHMHEDVCDIAKAQAEK